MNISKLCRTLGLSRQQISVNVGVKASHTPEEAAELFATYADGIRSDADRIRKKAAKYDRVAIDLLMSD